MRNLFKRIKTHIQNQWIQFQTEHPELVKPVLALGISFMTMNNQIAMAAGKDNIQTAIRTMVDIVSTIFLGVGVIYAIVAIFNWVSAMKAEDAEKQSKSITNIMIAAVLIAIKPITLVLVGALGGGEYMEGGESW